MTTKAIEYINQISTELTSVDRLLYKIGRALNNSQPPLEGRLIVRKWHPHGLKNGSEPFVIRQTRKKTKYPERVEEKALSRRASSRGPFALNYMETRELLSIYSDLYAYRKRLKELMFNIENSCRSTLNGNHGRLRESELSIINLDNAVHRKLVDNELDGLYESIGEKIIKD